MQLLYEEDGELKGGAVLDRRSHPALLEALVRTVQAKTNSTPPNDRADRILAIDGRSPAIGFNLFLLGVRLTDFAKFGWAGVLLVDGRNTRFLDREGWPVCRLCLMDSRS